MSGFLYCYTEENESQFILAIFMEIVLYATRDAEGKSMPLEMLKVKIMLFSGYINFTCTVPYLYSLLSCNI